MSWCVIHLPVCMRARAQTHTQPCSHAELETVLLCWGSRQKRVSRNRGRGKKELERARGRVRKRESVRVSELPSSIKVTEALTHWDIPRSLSTNCAGKWFLLSAKSYYPSFSPSILPSISLHHPPVSLFLSLSSVFPSLSLFPFGSVERHVWCLMDSGSIYTSGTCMALSLSLCLTHAHTPTHSWWDGITSCKLKSSQATIYENRNRKRYG